MRPMMSGRSAGRVYAGRAMTRAELCRGPVAADDAAAMPTYDATDTFRASYEGVTPEQQRAFRRVLPRFVEDTPSSRYRSSLRVKGIQGMPGCFEAAQVRASWMILDGRMGTTRALQRRPVELPNQEVVSFGASPTDTRTSRCFDSGATGHTA